MGAEVDWAPNSAYEPHKTLSRAKIIQPMLRLKNRFLHHLPCFHQDAYWHYFFFSNFLHLLNSLSLCFRWSSSCPWLLHGGCWVAAEERDVSPTLLHVLDWQPVHQIHLLVSAAKASAAVLFLGSAGEPSSQNGQHHRSRRQVIQTVWCCDFIKVF